MFALGESHRSQAPKQFNQKLMKQTTERHSDLKEWQAAIPQIPWYYNPEDATIRSKEEGTTIASIGGDLKLQELSAAGEYLCHCANMLPVLIEKAEAMAKAIGDAPPWSRDNIPCQTWNELTDAISEAKAEHLAGRFPEHLVERMEQENKELRTAASSLLDEIEKMSGQWLPETDVKVRFARVALGLEPMPAKDSPSAERMAEELLADAVQLATNDEIVPSCRLEKLTALLQERLSGHTKAS